jgi:hypothetical protein
MVEHKYIKASLLAFKKVMEKNKIQFWLEYGTQLGAVREGRIIPWDIDGDVGVWLADVQRMKDAEQDFLDAGIQLSYQPSHIYVNLKISEREWRMTLDVYTFDIIGDWLVRIENGKEKDVRSPIVYYIKLEDIQFLDTLFPVPWMAKSALEFAYGKEWKTPIKKPAVQIMIGEPTPEQLNKMGRTHHKKMEDL